MLAVFLTLSASSAWAGELLISAAASLTDIFNNIGKAFQQSHPGHGVVFNFAASGVLVQQLTQGAPVDVLATADVETMDKAGQQGLIIPNSRVIFALNSLVLAAPTGSTALESIQDLRKPVVEHITVGNPQTVSSGRYAQAALQKLGLWNTLQPKFVFSGSVRQSLAYIERGEVEAGFVFLTDAILEKQQVKLVTEVNVPVPIAYPIAIAANSKQPRLSHEFIAFVRSEPIQRLLMRYRFKLPGDVDDDGQ